MRYFLTAMQIQDLNHAPFVLYLFGLGLSFIASEENIDNVWISLFYYLFFLFEKCFKLQLRLIVYEARASIFIS